MSPCPFCGKEIDQSRYPDALEVHTSQGLRLAHLECCSGNDLKKLLALGAEREMEFFGDAAKLADSLSLENIRHFEEKYGDYDELAQVHRDHELVIAAIVAELKRRLPGAKRTT